MLRKINIYIEQFSLLEWMYVLKTSNKTKNEFVKNWKTLCCCVVGTLYNAEV